MHMKYPDPFMDICNGEIRSYGINKMTSAASVMNVSEIERYIKHCNEQRIIKKLRWTLFNIESALPT